VGVFGKDGGVGDIEWIEDDGREGRWAKESGEGDRVGVDVELGGFGPLRDALKQ
jgi:hypothetical protein